MILLNPKGDVNLHTHTCYCDGKDRPQELVEKAVELGFSAIGFSGHEYTAFDGDFCMTPEDTRRYRDEINELKEKYRDRIRIYLGVERDYFGSGSSYPYDFVIGSLHYVEENGEYLSVDESEQTMVDHVQKHFNGSFRDYVERYYETVACVVEKTGADIVGHFDLIAKFNEGGKYFDEEAPWYRRAALGALAKAAESRPIFEINTGAMARGYRSSPYPAPFLLEKIERLGCPLILSSDCHDRNFLDYRFNEIIEYLNSDRE